MLLGACHDQPRETQAQAEADTTQKTLYFNGDIITMEGDSAEYVEAVLVSDGKIAFVGKKEEAMKMAGDRAMQVDLEGKTMLPAFLDGHGHFYNVGFTSQVANILPPPDGPASDFQSIVETLKTWEESEQGKFVVDKFGWIIGNGYDDSQLKEKLHPKAEVLDQVSTEFPVIILHQSGHLGVVNSKALELLGYTKDTKNPEGGVIRRDAQGNPTGVLEENAVFQVLVSILAKSDEEFANKCIQKGQEEYAKEGYLTAQDGRTTPDQMDALRKGADSGLFFIDVVSYPDIMGVNDTMMNDYYSPEHHFKNHYRIGGVKLTLDGSPQGKTAWLTKPYLIPPEGQKKDYVGYPVMDDAKAIGYAKKAFEHQWQLLCHANGDASIDQYIMAVDSAEQAFGYEDHRTVMIHGQTLRKNQIPELTRLKILPSLFPMHTFYWGDWHVESVLGHPRADYISPCRDAIDAGMTITSHHDAPVTFPNSMRVLDATVNRVTRSGKILGPDQRISPYEGLKTLTDWASYQYFEEDTKGTITQGKLADFVILDKNPLKVDPMTIHEINIVESIKEGKSVYKE